MVPGLNGFDPERAYQNARSLSFPRKTGSDGEKRAAAYIAKRFRDMGLEVSEEEFSLILSPWIILKIGLIIGLLLLLFSRFIVYRHPLIASFIIFILLLSLMFTGPIWHWFARKGIKNPWGRKKSSRNIVARFTPPLNSPLDTTLYLMAHYDSKSQSLSLGRRLQWTIAALSSCLYLGINYILLALGSHYGGIRDGILLFIVLSALILFFNRSDNLSPGGLDNAGGVGLLLEIVEILSKNPPRDSDIVFVSTGAEEEGLMGAYAFLNTHRDEINPERDFILNFDGIGIKGRLRLFSKIKGLPKALNKLPSWPTFAGLMMDHIPFRSQGFKAVTLACVSTKEAFKIHTHKDTVDIISQEGIEEAGIIVREVIEGLKGG